MRGLVEATIKFRVALLLFSLLLTSFFIYDTVTQIKLYDDPNEWLPADNPIGKLNSTLQKQFGGGNLVTIQISVKEGDIFNAETLSKVKRITREIHLIWGVVPYNVMSIADLKAKYMKGSEEMLDITTLMDQVPQTPEEMERLKYGVRHNPLISGAFVSSDAKATMIQADFRTGLGLATDLPVTDPVAIYQKVKGIIEPERDNNHIIQATGTPIIIGWVNSEGLPYIAAAFGLFVVGIVTVLWFAFRSFRGAFIAIILGLVASVWAFGLKTLFQGPVLQSASALIAPFIIVAAAALHHTQFLKRFFDEEYPKTRDARLAIVNTFTPLLFPLLGSLVTDMVAFIVMSFVPFTNVSELGVPATFGLIAILFNVFFLQIPLLALLHGTPREVATVALRGKEKRKSALTRVVEGAVSDLVDRTWRGKLMVAAVIVLTLGSLLCLPYVNIGQDNTYAIHNFLTKSWKSNEIYQMEMNIREHFKGVYPLNILIESKEMEGLKEPEAVKAIDDYARFLEGLPEVAGVQGLPVYLKVLHQFFNGGVEEFYRVPQDRQEVALYLEFYAQGDPGSFDSVVDYNFQKHLLRVYTADTAHDTVRKVMHAAQEYAQTHFNHGGNLSVQVGGGAVAIAEGFNENIGKWLIYATVAGFVFSFLVLVPLSGSLLGPALLLLPLAMGTLIWLALMWLLGIEINSFTTTGMAMASGVGVDAELYLLGRFREEYAQHGNFQEALKQGFIAVREALTFSYLGLIAGCWILIPIPLYVGYVGFGMGLILVVCFLCSFVISPFLWSILRPKFLLKGVVPIEKEIKRAAV
jgi:predicted RND superfamily exporter protein